MHVWEQDLGLTVETNKKLSQKFELISILHDFCQTRELQKCNIHFCESSS